MNTQSNPNELMIHAYMDGELDFEDAAELQAWLSENPEARGEVEKWRRQKSALKARFDGVIDEEIPDAIREVIEQTGKKNRPWPFTQMAAGIALFALGAFSGWFLAQPDISMQTGNQVVAQRALNAHLVYVSEKLHPVEVEASKKAHLVKWLSKRLGYPLNVPDLSAQDFALVGGRLLPGGEGPAAQFMYEDRTGVRITLYVARNLSGNETSFQLLTEGRTISFYWLDTTLGYAIAGEIDEDRLLALARLVYQQIEENET